MNRPWWQEVVLGEDGGPTGRPTFLGSGRKERSFTEVSHTFDSGDGVLLMKEAGDNGDRFSCCDKLEKDASGLRGCVDAKLWWKEEGAVSFGIWSRGNVITEVAPDTGDSDDEGSDGSVRVEAEGDGRDIMAIADMVRF
jgi:hypothetical protein